MKSILIQRPRFVLMGNTFRFLRQHFLVILALGLIAAVGRVIQLGGFGTISPAFNILLEVIIETSRLVLLFYVLGLSNVKRGLKRMVAALSNRNHFKHLLMMALQKTKKKWLSILLNVTAFLLVAWGINYLIDLAAYETCFYLNLKEKGILVEASSEWTILLFFKNLTVIPLTFIFDGILVLWLLNKSQHVKALNPVLS